MRLADPAVLYLLVLPVVVGAILIAGIWLRRAAVARFGSRKTVELQLTRPSPYARAAKGIAFVIGVAGLILSAARPQYGGRDIMLPKRGIDIVVALDFSKSMLAQDIQPSRLARAKLELEDLISRLTGDRIGLVAFAGDTMRFPLTSDYAAASTFWKGLGPYDMPVGGTAIGKAIVASVRMLSPEDRKDDEDQKRRSKVILLITDGEDHHGDPLKAAEEAAKEGIIIHVLGIGSDSPELIPRYLDDGTPMGYQKDQDGKYVTSALSADNETALKDIAAKTGGRYIRAGTAFQGMEEVIDDIRKLRQHESQERKITVYEEIYQWALVPAFALLLISFLIPERLRQRR